MWSIGGKTLDVFDDPSLALLGESPYFEKVASLEMSDPAALDRLEDRQFGVVFVTKEGSCIRKYPLHDATNVHLSNVYFDLTAAKLPPEAKVAAATQIRSACQAFGVEPTPTVVKYAADGNVEGANYVRLGKVAQASRGDGDVFTQLLDEYQAHRDRYSRPEKVKLAQAMAPVAATHGFAIPADLQPFLVKNPVLDKEALLAQVGQRKGLLPERPEAGHLLDELVEKCAAFEPRETVSLLETFDRQFGLDRYWTRGLEPNLVLAEKEAAHTIPLRGASVSIQDKDMKAFVEANGDLLHKMFGKELAEKLRSDPGYVWQLPSASREFLAARMEHDRENAPAEAF